MNKRAHRLVFDRRRGMRVPAHERSRTAGKAAGGQSRAALITGAVLLACAADAMVAHAQTADGTKKAGTQTGANDRAAGFVADAKSSVNANVLAALNAPRPSLPTYKLDGKWALNTVGGVDLPVYSEDGKLMTLLQNGGTVILNWDSFDIANGYTVRFVQPDGGRALNRVHNASTSVIDGVLSANGDVMIENTAGVIFGSNARVDTRSMVATALKITDETFNKGIEAYRKGEAIFGGDEAAKNGIVAVEKGAQINALQGGRVIMVAPRVVNQGQINTPEGQAILAAGKTVYLYAPLDLAQRGLIVAVDNFSDATLAPIKQKVEETIVEQVDQDIANGLLRKEDRQKAIENAPRPESLGTVVNEVDGKVQAAKGGTINLVGAAIRQKGQLTATTAVKGLNGSIFLTAMKDTAVVGASAVLGNNTNRYPTDQVRVANNTGSIELAAGSVTEVLPSVEGLVPLSKLSKPPTEEELRKQKEELIAWQKQIDAGSKISVKPDEVLRVRNKPVEPKPLPSTATDEEKAAYAAAKAAYEADLVVYKSLLQQASDTFYRSRIDIIGNDIVLRSGATVQAPAGEVNILAASDWDSSTFFVPNRQLPQGQSTSRIVMESGAKVDVSGLDNLVLPSERNQLEGRLFSIELADAPLQRDGVVYRANLLADARRKISIGDVTGLYNNIRYSAAEYSTTGGQLRMQAEGALWLEENATIDFSGGKVTYEAGTVVSTLLLRDGAITKIENASRDQRYDTLVSDPSQSSSDDLLRLGLRDPGETAPAVLEAQEVGLSAGVAFLSAPAMSMRATLDGDVYMSEAQRLSADVAERAVDQDPRTLLTRMIDSSRVVSRPSLLTTSPHLYASLKPTAGGLYLGLHYRIENSLPTSSYLASVRITDTALAPTSLGSNWSEQVWAESLAGLGSQLVLTAAQLNRADLGSLNIQAGSVVVGDAAAGDVPELRFAGGGGLTVESMQSIQMDGRVLAPGGGVTLKAQNDGADILMGATAQLNVAGSVADERLDGVSVGSLMRKGGTVTLAAARSVSLAEGSGIDVSGAAWRSSAGALTQGTAGTVDVAINQQIGDVTSPLEGSLSLGATLSGFDFSKGGALSLKGLPAVVIGGEREGALSLGTGLFADRGFGKLTVSSIGHVEILADTQVQPQLVNMVAQAPRLGGFADKPYALAVLETGRRQGVSLTLSAETRPAVPGTPTQYGLPQGADVTVGAKALVDVGLGGSISLAAGGSVDVSGALVARGGTVSLSVKGTRGVTSAADNEPNGYLEGQGIHIKKDALIDVSGAVKSYLPDGTLAAKLGLPVREVGEVLAGGTITLGGVDGTTVRGRLTLEDGATLRLNGASAWLDRGLLPGKSLISATAGTLNIMSTDGFELLGRIEAKAPDASVAGGTLNMALSHENSIDGVPYNSKLAYPSGSDAGKRSIRIMGTNTEASALADSGLKFGEGVVSAELLNNAGFDRIALRADESIQLNAGANLVAPEGRTRLQSVVLNSAVVELTDAQTHVIQAHHVGLGPHRPLTLVTLPGVVSASTRAAAGQLKGTGDLEVQAGLIEVYGDTAVLGADAVALNATLSPTAKAGFDRRNGEIRFIGTPSVSSSALKGQLSFTGNLSLWAGQVYATTLSNYVVAGYSADGKTTAGELAIHAPQEGSLSQGPLSALAQLSMRAGDVEIDGTLHQPFGAVSVDASKLHLTNRADVSVSGEGLQVPVGGTINQKTWTYAPQGRVIADGSPNLIAASEAATVINLTDLPVNKQITLDGGTLTMSNLAAVEAQAGGDILAWEFKKGVGGSTDTYARNNVFAILPGYSYDFAPYDTEIRAGSLTLGTGLKVGDQVSISTPNGVLAAGTYTLLDARYALLPGAVLVSPTTLAVTSALPVAIQNDDGSVVVSGHKTATGTTQNGGGDQRLAWVLEPESTFRKKSEILVTSGNAYQRDRAERSNLSYVLPGDAGRISLVSDSPFDWAARFNLKGNPDEGLRAGQFDLVMPDMVVQADTSQAVPTGAKSVSLAQLNSLGAESILLGGVRTTQTDGSIRVSRKANSITFQADVDALGVPVPASSNFDPNLLQTDGELFVVTQATGTVRVEGGVSIVSSGVDTGEERRYVLEGDGSSLLVSNLSRTSVAVTDTGSSTSGLLEIGSDGTNGNVTLKGNAVQIDASNQLKLALSTVLSTRALGLGGKRIAVGASTTERKDLGDGTIDLSDNLLAAANAAERLQLRSATSIDFYGATQLGSERMAQITLDAPQLLGTGTPDQTASVEAQEVVLANTSGQKPPMKKTVLPDGKVKEGEETGSSILRVTAHPVLSDGRTGGLTVAASLSSGAAAGQVGQRLAFAQTHLESTGDIVFSGQGRTVAQGNLVLSAARVTADSTSKQSVDAGGTLTVEAKQGAITLGESVGAGGELNLSGGQVIQKGVIDIEAGQLGIVGRGVAGESTTVDFAKDSKTRVDGRLRMLADDYAVASGAGAINVEARAGQIRVDGLLSAAAPVIPANVAGENRYAGSISLKSAAQVELGVNAKLNLDAAQGKTGSLTVDAQDLSVTTAVQQANAVAGATARSALDKLIEASRTASGFSLREADIRVRNGDLSLSTELKAALVKLYTDKDQGKLELRSGAVVNATAPQGGVVQLSAQGDLILHTGAEVLAQSTRDGANGGDILLSSAKGSVQFGNAKVVADSDGDDKDGRIVIRALQTLDAGGEPLGDMNVALLPTDLRPAGGALTLTAGQIELEGLRVYKDAPNASEQHTSVVQEADEDSTTAWGLNNFMSDAEDFLTTENKSAILNKLGLQGRSEVHVKAGVEVQSLGNLNIGDGQEIDLSALRPGGEPMTFTFRAARDLRVLSTLSDGFKKDSRATVGISAQAGDASTLRFVAGAELTSSNVFSTLPDASSGHFTLDGGRVIRTTAGSIDVHASGDVRLMAPAIASASAIYVAGQASELDDNEYFKNASGVQSDDITQAYSGVYDNARFTERGGRLTVTAGGSVGSYKEIKTTNGVEELVPQQVLQMTGNYFFHGGSATAPVTWWSGLNAFRQGLGSFGGGNILVEAGQNISNVPVVSPTNARTVQVSRGDGTEATVLKELNGGDIELLAGNNIDGGVYFLGRGQGRIAAGGGLNLGADSVAENTLPGNTRVVFEPGAMFGVMDGHWDVSTGKELNLAYVFNPTALLYLPQGGSTTDVVAGSKSAQAASGIPLAHAAVYFTYQADAGVSLASLNGSVNWEANPQSLNRMHNYTEPASTDATGTDSTYAAFDVISNSTSNAAFLAGVTPPVVNITSLNDSVSISTKGKPVSSNATTRGNADVQLIVMPSAQSDVNIYAGNDVSINGNIQLIDVGQVGGGLPTVTDPFRIQSATSSGNSGKNVIALNQSLSGAPGNFKQGISIDALIKNQISDLGQADNDNVVHVFAGQDVNFVSGLLRSNRPLQMVAGRDLNNLRVFAQNFSDTDVTRLEAGRDFINGTAVIGGPGGLKIEAGQDILFNQSLGVFAVANQINAALPEASAKITLSAGNARAVNFDVLLGRYGAEPLLRSEMNAALVSSGLPAPSAGNWSAASFDEVLLTFRQLKQERQSDAVASFLNGLFVQRYMPELAGQPEAYFRSEAFLKQKQEVLWRQIDDLAGRAVSIAVSDNSEEEARRVAQRKALFEQAAAVVDLAGLGVSFSRVGDIDLSTAKVHNLGPGGGDVQGQVDNSVGGIDVIAPGQVLVGLPQKTLTTPAGFINFNGGSFRSITNGDFLAGDQKVIVVGRGNLFIYTTDGDIDSGKGSNTSAAKPLPTRVFDVATGKVITQGQPPTSGSGFQTVQSPEDAKVKIGLYAPNGEIRALDAYIIGPDVQLVAPKVVGADNIANATGTPAAPPPVVNLSLAPKVSDTAAGVSQAADASGTKAKDKQASSQLTVELLGFGGGEGDSSAAATTTAPATAPAAGAATATPAAPAAQACEGAHCNQGSKQGKGDKPAKGGTP